MKYYISQLMSKGTTHIYMIFSHFCLLSNALGLRDDKRYMYLTVVCNITLFCLYSFISAARIMY